MTRVVEDGSTASKQVPLSTNRKKTTEWMQYIDDQRCSSSWYFVLNDEGLYEVGFYDSNTDPARSSQVVHENAMDACAAFIKQQI